LTQLNKASLFYCTPVCSARRQNGFIDYTAFDPAFDEIYSRTSIELFQSSTCPDDIRIKTNTRTFFLNLCIDGEYFSPIATTVNEQTNVFPKIDKVQH